MTDHENAFRSSNMVCRTNDEAVRWIGSEGEAGSQEMDEQIGYRLLDGIGDPLLEIGKLESARMITNVPREFFAQSGSSQER